MLGDWSFDDPLMVSTGGAIARGLRMIFAP